jgi:hypothetical protein
MNACDIFKQKNIASIFLIYSPLIKDHKIKNSTFLSLKNAKKLFDFLFFFFTFFIFFFAFFYFFFDLFFYHLEVEALP